MAAQRVAKICVLLGGNDVESDQGLKILQEELDGGEGVEVLRAFLSSSPLLKEIADLIEKKSQQSLSCLASAMRIGRDEGRLFTAVHNVITNHVSKLQLWLSGDRGANNCETALKFLADTNIYSHSILHHRLKLRISGPWIGPEAAWKKKKAAYSAKSNIRIAGIEFLLSFCETKEDQSKEMAIGAHGFLSSLTSTIQEDSDELRSRITTAVSNLMSCSSIPRAKRAHAFERKGVIPAFMSQLNEKSSEQQTKLLGQLTKIMIPALVVPETPYSLTASVIPNQVLLQILKSCSPMKYMSHRTVFRVILSSAPALSYHFMQYAADGVLSLTSSEGVFDTLMPLNVAQLLLECDLPDITHHFDDDSYLVELVLPNFIGSALSQILKRKESIVVSQGLQVVYASLCRLRLIQQRLGKASQQLSLFSDSSDESCKKLKNTISTLKHNVSQRLPAIGTLILTKKNDAGDESLFTSYKYEKILLTVRLLQLELPQHIYSGGFNTAKLYLKSISELPKSSAVMLLQVLAHDSQSKSTLTLCGSGGSSVKRSKSDSAPLSEIISFYHVIASETISDGNQCLLAAIEILLHSMLSNLLVVPTVCKATRTESNSWIRNCTTSEAQNFLCECIVKMVNDITSIRDPFTGPKQEGSLLLSVAKRGLSKITQPDDSIIEYVRAVENGFLKDISGRVNTYNPSVNVPDEWGLLKIQNKISVATPVAILKRDVSPDGEESLLTSYNGTMSCSDLEKWDEVKSLLSSNNYQAGPKSSGIQDIHWIQTLASTLTSKRMQYTLDNYPTDPSLISDEGRLLDPRYVTTVLAAHLALYASKSPPVVPEIRRMCLQGYVPLLLLGLSSRDDDVRQLSYTSMGILHMLSPPMSPFTLFIAHVKNSCWKPMCRLPNFMSVFFSFLAEGLFRPKSAKGSLTQGLHNGIVRYLSNSPFTRRGDFPLSQSVLETNERGTGMMTLVLQVAQRCLLSMGTARCKNSISTIVSSGVLVNALTVINDPVTNTDIRQMASKTLEAGMSTLPDVMLSKLKILVPVSAAAVSLRPAVVGVKATVLRKNWELRSRLVAMITLSLLNLPETFSVAPALVDFTASYHILTSIVATLQHDVCSDASLLFTSIVMTLTQLLSRMAVKPGYDETLVAKLRLLQKAYTLSNQRGSCVAAVDRLVEVMK